MPLVTHILEITAADDQTDAESVASRFLFPSHMRQPSYTYFPFDTTQKSEAWNLRVMLLKHFDLHRRRALLVYLHLCSLSLNWAHLTYLTYFYILPWNIACLCTSIGWRAIWAAWVHTGEHACMSRTSESVCCCNGYSMYLLAHLYCYKSWLVFFFCCIVSYSVCLSLPLGARNMRFRSTMNLWKASSSSSSSHFYPNNHFSKT